MSKMKQMLVIIIMSMMYTGCGLRSGKVHLGMGFSTQLPLDLDDDKPKSGVKKKRKNGPMRIEPMPL